MFFRSLRRLKTSSLLCHRPTLFAASTCFGLGTSFLAPQSNTVVKSSNFDFQREPLSPPSPFDQIRETWQSEFRQLFEEHPASSPSWKARDLLIASNIAVYALWKVLSVTRRGEFFFFKHFVSSAENLQHRRIHSLVLSGFTHLTLGHLFVNCFGIYVFLGDNCLGTTLSEKETYWVYMAASSIAALLQIRHSQQKVVGASGAIMAYIVLESFLNPLQQFMLLFPIPGMLISSVQIAQFSFILNALFTLSNKRHPYNRVAWFGHLVGMAVGAAYAEYQRHIGKDTRFQKPLPKITDSVAHWRSATSDFIYSARLYWLKFQIRYITDPIRWAELRFEIEELQRRKLEHKLRKKRGGDSFFP